MKTPRGLELPGELGATRAVSSAAEAAVSVPRGVTTAEQLPRCPGELARLRAGPSRRHAVLIQSFLQTVWG